MHNSTSVGGGRLSMNLSFVGESLPKMVVLAQFKTLVPRLATSLRKGEAGIIAVVGGSLEYTGVGLRLT